MMMRSLNVTPVVKTSVLVLSALATAVLYSGCQGVTPGRPVVVTTARAASPAPEPVRRPERRSRSAVDFIQRTSAREEPFPLEVDTYVPPPPARGFDEESSGESSEDGTLFTIPGSSSGFDELLAAGLARESDPAFSMTAPPVDWREFSPDLEYETQPMFTMGDDCRELIPNLLADTKAMFTWRNAFILGAGAGLAIGLRENVDGEVRAWTAEHPERWGGASAVLRDFGEFTWQVPVLLTGYAWSLWRQDSHFHEFMLSTISSYTLTSVSTVALKGMTDTSRPTTEFEDGQYGFPSFHAASTFSIAANIDSYYGWKAGIPAYVLAGLVGWSRIDQREHDLSDVVFGSILGFTIGKTVAAARQERAENWQVVPYYDGASQSAGVLFDVKY